MTPPPLIGRHTFWLKSENMHSAAPWMALATPYTLLSPVNRFTDSCRECAKHQTLPIQLPSFSASSTSRALITLEALSMVMPTHVERCNRLILSSSASFCAMLSPACATSKGAHSRSMLLTLSLSPTLTVREAPRRHCHRWESVSFMSSPSPSKSGSSLSSSSLPKGLLGLTSHRHFCM